MECNKCNFYKSGQMWNCCELTGDEYFHQLDNCDLVNDDGIINQENLNKAFGGT